MSPEEAIRGYFGMEQLGTDLMLAVKEFKPLRSRSLRASSPLVDFSYLIEFQSDT